MSYMFHRANAFNEDISSWDTSACAVMSNMFSSASAFNINIDSWDVSNVKYLPYMFEDSRSFSQCLSSWGEKLTIKSQSGIRNMFRESACSSSQIEPGFPLNDDSNDWCGC